MSSIPLSSGPILVDDGHHKYSRFEKIGSGAFKTVYRGVNHETGIEVAWNEIRLPSGSDEQSARMKKIILQEIELLQTLHHENIISIYDAWRDEDRQEILFVTEYMASGTLKSYLSRVRKISVKALRNFCRQVLRGLSYLHNHDPPIIHRDIKCENIFMNGSRGEVKIGDLGLSSVLKDNRYAVSLIGTPEFIAPEVYNEKYTTKADIYAFGMCVIEMATGKYPYSECQTSASVLKRVLEGSPPEALNLIAHADLKSFIECCLLPEESRWTADDLLEHEFLNMEEEDDRVIHVKSTMDSDGNINEPDFGVKTIVLSEEEKRVYISLSLQSKKKNREIKFWFDLNRDTAHQVSEEMCREFGFPDNIRVLVEKDLDQIVETKRRGPLSRDLLPRLVTDTPNIFEKVSGDSEVVPPSETANLELTPITAVVEVRPAKPSTDDGINSVPLPCPSKDLDPASKTDDVALLPESSDSVQPVVIDATLQLSVSESITVEKNEVISSIVSTTQTESKDSIYSGTSPPSLPKASSSSSLSSSDENQSKTESVIALSSNTSTLEEKFNQDLPPSKLSSISSNEDMGLNPNLSQNEQLIPPSNSCRRDSFHSLDSISSAASSQSIIDSINFPPANLRTTVESEEASLKASTTATIDEDSLFSVSHSHEALQIPIEDSSPLVTATLRVSHSEGESSSNSVADLSSKSPVPTEVLNPELNPAENSEVLLLQLPNEAAKVSDSLTASETNNKDPGRVRRKSKKSPPIEIDDSLTLDELRERQERERALFEDSVMQSRHILDIRFTKEQEALHRRQNEKSSATSAHATGESIGSRSQLDSSNSSSNSSKKDPKLAGPELQKLKEMLVSFLGPDLDELLKSRAKSSAFSRLDVENGVRRGVTRTIAVLSDKLIEVLNLTRLFGGPGLPRDQADEGNITSCFPEPVSLEGLNDAQRTDFCTEFCKSLRTMLRSLIDIRLEADLALARKAEKKSRDSENPIQPSGSDAVANPSSAPVDVSATLPSDAHSSFSFASDASMDFNSTSIPPSESISGSLSEAPSHSILKSSQDFSLDQQQGEVVVRGARKLTRVDDVSMADSLSDNSGLHSLHNASEANPTQRNSLRSSIQRKSSHSSFPNSSSSAPTAQPVFNANSSPHTNVWTSQSSDSLPLMLSSAGMELGFPTESKTNVKALSPVDGNLDLRSPFGSLNSRESTDAFDFISFPAKTPDSISSVEESFDPTLTLPPSNSRTNSTNQLSYTQTLSPLQYHNESGFSDDFDVSPSLSR